MIVVVVVVVVVLVVVVVDLEVVEELADAVVDVASMVDVAADSSSRSATPPVPQAVATTAPAIRPRMCWTRIPTRCQSDERIWCQAAMPVDHYRSATISAISSPASVGLSPTLAPASVSASILAAAVPLPPETMAPA